ncbi:MAG: DUF2117 domain-containing protein [Methanomicrobiales archaeon]|nr:DUF2117 domain-containing protein [Methanomicrobiales archaeon]
MPATLPDRTLPRIMVVHGVEAFDHGDVERFISLLSPARRIVAGVMARTAAEERNLGFECPGKPPSQVFRQFEGRCGAFLVNRGRSPDSGRIFGEIVASRLPAGEGLVQIECSAGVVLCWNGGDARLAADIADRAGFAFEHAEATPVPAPRAERTIRGCRAGDPVYVNGTVIGTATGDTVTIACRQGTILAIGGLDAKPHGIEKAARQGIADLSRAWCKSGTIRCAGPLVGARRQHCGRICVIDHAGQTLYDALSDDVCGVLSIGDDTTAVCGHVCAHRGIPVFGIVDGDADGILPAGFAGGSVVVHALRERDDDIGAELAATVRDHSYCWETWIDEMLDWLGGRVRIAVDTRDSR